ncbi:MAG TPA: glycosyltransferase family 39 protein, partial [Longilinea sp.]|nr:glycosyltransferase family 39 protein [Longilinea sp.]
KNSVWLGYSLERWLMIGSVFALAFILCLLFLVKQTSRGNGLVSELFGSKWFSVLFLLSLFIIFLFILYLRGDPARLLRLCPVLVLGCLTCFQVLVYQNTTSRNPAQYKEEIFAWLDKKNVIVWFALLASIPLLFTNAIKYDNPMGFAGLYTQMAEDIARVNFLLPLNTPFYGPGGIPFAYPPLGLYLMAVFLKLGVPTWAYLRFAPPVFSLLALVPIYLLARRMLRSKFGGVVTLLLASSSSILYLLQTESGGVVRCVAFGLGLLAVYFFDRMVGSFRWRDAVLSGVFFGLTVLSHVGYAFYFAFWFIAWVLTNPQKRKTWLGAVTAAIVSLMVALPWIFLMVERYGISIFSTVSQSHGTFSIIRLFQNPGSILPVLWESLACVYRSPIFLAFVLVGLAFLLINKKFTLPLLLVLSVVINQGERSIMLVCYFIIGYAVSNIYQLITSKIRIPNKLTEKIISSLVIMGLFIPFYWLSFDTFTQQHPLLDQDMLDAGSYLQNNTSPQETYLSLYTNDSQEDEWFPYLSHREPVIGIWGSEWLGTMDTQYDELAGLYDCISIQNLSCLNTWLESTDLHPDYILMVSNLEELAVSLGHSSEWENVYSNDRYLIWKPR